MQERDRIRHSYDHSLRNMIESMEEEQTIIKQQYRLPYI